ncbi:MAG: OmpH family outer membrane protein [Treponema sp.]|nr:OmpH family outer membrane protein [Candidatus Treponema caballi]
MKKITVILLLTFIMLVPVVAQAQLTKFGVIDTSRVYNAYFRNSTGSRNYEQKKADFQAEVDRMTEELKALQTQKLELEAAGDEDGAHSLETTINTRTAALTQYTKTKNIELENLKSNLASSDEFYNNLYSVIEKIAESNGLSLILSLQQANAVIWYSESVDITQQVIDALGSM